MVCKACPGKQIQCKNVSIETTKELCWFDNKKKTYGTIEIYMHFICAYQKRMHV